MKKLNEMEIETIAGGINPGLLPMIVIYVPKLIEQVKTQEKSVDTQ